MDHKRGPGPEGGRLETASGEDELRRHLAQERNKNQALTAHIQALQAELARMAAVNSELDRFASEVAHELTQPLTTAGGFLHLLDFELDESLDERARALLQNAIGAIDRLNATLAALRSYARLGAAAFHPEDVDLSQLVDRVLLDLDAMLRGAGAKVAVGPLPIVRGDRALLGQLFANLVSNAVKFGRPAVPPQVEVTCSAAGDLWTVTVDDNGIGVPPEQREKVFDAFVRLPNGSDRPGSGLGLAIAHRVLQRHGGRIGIDDSPLGGTRLVVELPRA